MPRKRQSADGLYASLFSAEERAGLTQAAHAEDLEAEIGLLRTLIRRAVEKGSDLEATSRALSRLATLLRVNHVLTGDAARSLDEALSRALELIGEELAGGEQAG